MDEDLNQEENLYGLSKFDLEEIDELMKNTIAIEETVAPWQCLAMEDKPLNHLLRAKMPFQGHIHYGGKLPANISLAERL